MHIEIKIDREKKRISVQEINKEYFLFRVEKEFKKFKLILQNSSKFLRIVREKELYDFLIRLEFE